MEAIGLAPGSAHSGRLMIGVVMLWMLRTEIGEVSHHARHTGGG